MEYAVVAFYVFTELDQLSVRVSEWRSFFEALKANGRIYLSKMGVNAQVSLKKSQIDCLNEWLGQQKAFRDVYLNIQSCKNHAFAKLIVKERQQLVALDKLVDLSYKGKYLTPDEWKQILDSNQNYLLIDVRNSYEYAIGHFKGAIDPGLKTFRDFPSYLEKLKTQLNKDQKVLMSCTGGIRCELFSSLMLQEGFTDVNQLQGGMIAYGNKHGNTHFEGKLFVFDDRMAVSIDEKGNPQAISHCQFCNRLSDVYYNCANMDCNKLFLACQNCYIKQRGCCQTLCLDTPRRRQISGVDNIPFRKWYRYFRDKKSLISIH